MIYSIFGFNVETDYRFTVDFPIVAGNRDLSFSCVRRDDPRSFKESQLLFASKATNHHGEPESMLFDAGDAQIMRFPRIADFIIRPDSIVCELLDPECAYLAQICLLGHVFGYYLESRGIAPIHGASLAIGDHAVILVGSRGAGKSTMAGSLLKAGLPLLADDISAIEPADENILCRPAYPQIKLTPDQARLFGLEAENYEKVHPAFEKLSVPVFDIGTFQTTPLPARCVYLLERSNEDDAPIRIESLPAGEALIELLKHSFITETTEATDLRTERMKRLARIVRNLCVKRLCYPSGYQHLPGLLEAISIDVEETGQPG